MFSQVRFATRGLVRWRGGALAAVVTLAIGIGAATALYGLVQVILPGLPGVPDVDRLGRIYASSPELGVERSPIAINEFDDTLSKTRSFAAIGAYAETDAAIGSGADVQPATAAYATPAFFTAMGVPPAAGRAFTAADLGQPVVIVSEALWRRQFGDRRLEGAAITVDGVERAVVGVMPPEFAYRFIGISGDLWIPLGRASIKAPVIVSIYARLRTGVDWTAAASELSALSRGEWKWRAIPVDADMRSRATMAYAFTLGPALLILLIACVNVACMLLGRGLQREKELSVRRALGASRAAIVRLLLVENLVLAIAAGAIGAGLAIWILRAAGGVLSALQPGVARVVADARLLPFALGASAMACLLFGVVPALRLSRRDVAASLNGVPPEHRVEIAGYGGRDVIVFAEIASAVGLIVWTAMLFTLFGELRAIRFTFPADRVVAMRVPAETAGAVASRVASVPGVTGAAISSGMMGGSRVRAQAEGPLGAARGGLPAAVVSRLPVGRGFFETVGLALVRGRSFDASEVGPGAAVAVLSESAARELAPGRDPIGLRLRFAGPGGASVVIGVCRDAIDYGTLAKAGALAPAQVYVPYQAEDVEAVVLARVSAEPHAALRAIGAAAQPPAGRRPPRPVVLSDDMRDHSRDSGVVLARLIGAFALLSLLLAASGVFAVTSQSVAQRTREFGIRLALGAAPRRVLGMVLAREAKLIAIAIAVGLAFTMALTRALFVELARLSAIVPSMWIGALALSGGIAALAVMLGTCRIIRLEPAAVLRRL